MDGSGMHQPISRIVLESELNDLIEEHYLMADYITRLDDRLEEYETRPELIYKKIQAVKESCLPICIQLLRVIGRLPKRLKEDEKILGIEDTLLDIYNEVDYDDTKHRSKGRPKNMG